MNGRSAFWIKGMAALAVLWLLVFGGMKWAGSRRPTPEKIRAYLEANPLTEIEDSAKRKEVIGKTAEMLNQLEPDQFQDFEKMERDRERQERLFRSMTPDERMYFMEKRVGKAFQQMMAAFNDMDRDERRRIVERSLKRMKDNPGRGPAGERLEEMDPEFVEKVTSAGLKSYYQDASAETKLDLAPLLEEMQNVMGGGGRKGPPLPRK